MMAGVILVTHWFDGGSRTHASSFHIHHQSHLRPLSRNPAVMPRINVPPATLAKIKEAMASAGKEILQSRSAKCKVFAGLSTNRQQTVEGTIWEMWLP